MMKIKYILVLLLPILLFSCSGEENPHGDLDMDSLPAIYKEQLDKDTFAPDVDLQDIEQNVENDPKVDSIEVVDNTIPSQMEEVSTLAKIEGKWRSSVTPSQQLVITQKEFKEVMLRGEKVDVLTSGPVTTLDTGCFIPSKKEKLDGQYLFVKDPKFDICYRLSFINEEMIELRPQMGSATKYLRITE